jgi:hypothetical protein
MMMNFIEMAIELGFWLSSVASNSGIIVFSLTFIYIHALATLINAIYLKLSTLIIIFHIEIIIYNKIKLKCR